MSGFEYDYEPIPGLPGNLPSGERLLWQGSPAWWPLARRALRVLPVSLYFGLLALWQASSAWSVQHSLVAVRHSVTLPLLLGAAVVAMLMLVAWFSARATVYSITNHRLVIRHGIALPMSLNLPFAQIRSAAASLHRDGTGELALVLPKQQRVGYLLNWPHVRPGRYVQPQPTLRSLRDAAQVAQLLSTALREFTSAPAITTPAAPANSGAGPAMVRVTRRTHHQPAASVAA